MGYRGSVLRIPCNRGGFNYSQNTDMIDPTMFVFPSKNINLHEDGRHKRGGTTKKNSTQGYGNARLMGGVDFQLPTQSFQVVQGDDGNLYRDSTTVLKSGMSTSNFASFAVFGNKLYVCDGHTVPQVWDGAAGATSDISAPAADWSGTNQPFQVISHGVGASRRLWYVYGNSVYYTALNDGGNVTGGGKITIDTGDAYGLVGGIEFQNRIFLFSRLKAFIIDDTDIDTANWGYERAAWGGGAAHWRLMTLTMNDLMVMGDDGEIYSIASVQAYGDYKRASVSRPAFVDNFIRTQMQMSTIANWHMTYDPVLRALFTWMTRSGLSTNDTSLVFFIDRPPNEGWVIHDNQTSASGYKASCSFTVRDNTLGTTEIWTGDYAGFVWRLNQATRSDDGVGYYAGFRLPHLVFDNPRVGKHFKRGFVVARTQGNYNLQISIWVDGAVQTGTSISLSGAGGVLGAFILGVDTLGGSEFIDREFDLNFRGKRLQLEFFNNVAGQDFFVSQILIDHRLHGGRPQ